MQNLNMNQRGTFHNIETSHLPSSSTNDALLSPASSSPDATEVPQTVANLKPHGWVKKTVQVAHLQMDHWVPEQKQSLNSIQGSNVIAAAKRQGTLFIPGSTSTRVLRSKVSVDSSSTDPADEIGIDHPSVPSELALRSLLKMIS